MALCVPWGVIRNNENIIWKYTYDIICVVQRRVLLERWLKKKVSWIDLFLVMKVVGWDYIKVIFAVDVNVLSFNTLGDNQASGIFI